jgi:mannose-6-phosphate isomerase-like protein (cupin superfamily)
MKTGLAETLANLPKAGERYTVARRHGTMRLGLYAPKDQDAQTPHAQDELYVVTRGRGEFVCAGERVSFETGDVLFAPAGIEHRFENFSADFATWVVFYGPEGGEQSTTPTPAAKKATKPRAPRNQKPADDNVRAIRIVRDPEPAPKQIVA